MPNDLRSYKISGHTPAIAVEGHGVPQPVHIAIQRLKRFTSQRKKIQQKINALRTAGDLSPEQERTLQAHQRALATNTNRINQWAIPLHAFAPHKYPAPNTYLT